MVEGLPPLKQEIAMCEACIISEQNQDPFFTSGEQNYVCNL